MSLYDISNAFDADFVNFELTGVGVGTGDIVFEGQPYTPNEGNPYIITRMAAYSRVPISAGPTPAYQETGTYQVSVVRPIDEGAGRAMYIADQVVAYYPRSKILVTATSVSLSLLSASAMPAMPSGDWYLIPVVVSWFCTGPS